MYGSIEWNFESQYVIFPDYWLGATTILFGLSTVDYTTYAHGQSYLRQKKRVEIYNNI